MVLVGGDGDGDVDMIKELERLRGTPDKRIEIIGCTYLDVLREKLETNGSPCSYFDNTDKTTVLISPTWGDLGLLSQYGRRLLDPLITSGKYNIIIRPHPQSYISEKELLVSFKLRYPENGTLL